MTKEIVRELVNGEWVTAVRDAGAGGGSVSEITSIDMSVTITDPTGPTVDLSVSGGLQPVSVASVTLDAADLGVIGDTGFQLVAAQTGKIIVPISATYQYVPGGTPYTTESGVLRLQVGASFYGASVADSLLAGTAGVSAESFGIDAGAPITDPVVSEALMLWDDTSSPTDGDGTLTVTVVYYLVDDAS